MAITTPTTGPASTDGVANLEINMLAFVNWAHGIPAEINPLITGNISMGSTTSLTIGTGSKAPVLTTNTPFAKGMYAVIHSTADPLKWMAGTVTDYVSGTKTLTISSTLTSGHTDTLSDWNVIVGAPPVPVGITGHTNRVWVKDGNGTASNNNKIRRFTTVVSITGDAIFYADSATDGGSFTILKAGWYAINYLEAFNYTTINYAGISVNGNQLTTGIDGITQIMRPFWFGVSSTNTKRGSRYTMLWLDIGDIVRAQIATSTPTDFAAGDVVRFDIAKVEI